MTPDEVLDQYVRERERDAEREAKRPARKRSTLTPAPVKPVKRKGERAPIAYPDEVGRLLMWVGVALFWVLMAVVFDVHLGPGGSLN